MNSKLNNYHFGRQVFEYFPWYNYDNKDIKSLPILNNIMRRDFSFAFDNAAVYTWVRESGGDLNEVSLHTIAASVQVIPGFYESYFYSIIGGPGENSMDDPTLLISGNKATYRKMEETIETWEDIEKIRLRCILGTREKAESYMKIIDLYTKYHDLILDMIYTQSGEEIEISAIGIKDFMERGNYQEACMSFIEDDDVYKYLNKNYNKMVQSMIYESYIKNGFLTPNQIEEAKKSLHKPLMEQLKEKKLTFLYVKTNNVPNISRVTDYFEEIGLKYKKFNDFILVY